MAKAKTSKPAAKSKTIKEALAEHVPPKRGKGRPKKGSSDPLSPEDPNKRVSDILARLAKAEGERDCLIDHPEIGYGYQARLSILTSQVWRLRGDLLFLAGQHKEAHMANKTASDLASEAAKMEQASLGDRVHVIENRISATRDVARGLAALQGGPGVSS